MISFVHNCFGTFRLFFTKYDKYNQLRQTILNGFIIFIISMIFCEFANAGFKIILMQDNKKTAANFRPLIHYFDKNGIDVSFVAAKNYPHAATMFSQGLADGMFSGSGIAGCMIIKELAKPVIRPVSKDGWSTYWAVVLSKEGSSRFTQNMEYFNAKRVIFCSLASSGEFFFHSLNNDLEIKTSILKASSHGAAIDSLSRGVADIAIVKNRVWDSVKKKYPNIIRVGEDPGENPNGTLIVSNKTDHDLIEKVSKILLNLKNDTSIEAKLIKETLNITGYTETNIKDFRFTLALLKKAGVSKSFDFSF